MAIPTVIFKSVNSAARTATFTVNGADVVRRIPATFEGSIDAYLKALGEGLVIEFSSVEEKPIAISTIKAGDNVKTFTPSAEAVVADPIVEV